MRINKKWTFAAAGMAAMAIGTLVPVASAQTVTLPEVANACGAFTAPAINPATKFDVSGAFVSHFTYDPLTMTVTDYAFQGQPVFTKIELANHTFDNVKDLAVDGDTFSARSRGLTTTGDKVEARLEILDCENAETTHRLDVDNSVGYFLAPGYHVQQVPDQNVNGFATVLITKDPTNNTNPPLAMRIDGDPGKFVVARATDTPPAGTPNIVFNGRGRVTFRVVTAADHLPINPACPPVLCLGG